MSHLVFFVLYAPLWLFAHEAGHYFAAVVQGADATVTYGWPLSETLVYGETYLAFVIVGGVILPFVMFIAFSVLHRDNRFLVLAGLSLAQAPLEVI